MSELELWSLKIRVEFIEIGVWALQLFQGHRITTKEAAATCLKVISLISSKSSVNLSVSVPDSRIGRGDSPEITVEEIKNEPISYIPRVSPGKRGAVLTWALPNNRIRVAGPISNRQPASFELVASRPAARK